MKRDKKERKARTDGKGTLDQKEVRVLGEPQGNRDPWDLKAKRLVRIFVVFSLLLFYEI